MNLSDAHGLTPWEFAHRLQEEHLSDKEQYVAADVCDVLALNLLAALPPNQRSLLEQFPVIVLPTHPFIPDPYKVPVIPPDAATTNSAVLTRFL